MENLHVNNDETWKYSPKRGNNCWYIIGLFGKSAYFQDMVLEPVWIKTWYMFILFISNI